MEPPRLNALESRLQPLRAALDRNVSTAGTVSFLTWVDVTSASTPGSGIVPRRGQNPRSHGWYAAVRMYTGYVMAKGRGVSAFISKSMKRSAQRRHYSTATRNGDHGSQTSIVAGEGRIVGNGLSFRV